MASVVAPPASKKASLKRSESAVRGSERSLRLVFYPIGFLAASLLLPRVNESSRVMESIAGAIVVLLAFFFVLRRRVIRSGRNLQYEFVPQKVHYVQLCMHSCVYAYWGWYWRNVYDFIPLILVQLAFVYALDMLVCWSRRDKWILGFGPFPIVLSTNLFLWFKDDWFYLQFVLIAVGVLGKEFIKWKREGRLTHIFNPSALSLFLFSVVLIATKSTDLTWGVEISATFHRPPHIYLEIFLLGLIVQSLFRVTLVTLWSAVALYVLNFAYTRATGDYNFIDSNIPVAVFLGLHLLVTDPATSPRRALGKIIFGLMYGAGVFFIYRLLSSMGAPEFYDKLLCVPFLNLMVIGLDKSSDAVYKEFRTHFGHLRALVPSRANYAWMTVWVCFFAMMMTTGFLAKGNEHPGSKPSYWQARCEQGNHKSCETWGRILYDMCEDNSAQSCINLARLSEEGRSLDRNPRLAGISYAHACDLGSKDACSELVKFAGAGGGDVLSKACDSGDAAGCFVLGSLYSAGNGVVQNASLAFQLFQRSCDMGWYRGCGRLGISYLVGQGTARDPNRAVHNLEKGCHGGNAPSCFEVARVYWEGTAGKPRRDLARERLSEACRLGLVAACQQAASVTISGQ